MVNTSEEFALSIFGAQRPLSALKSQGRRDATGKGPSSRGSEVCGGHRFVYFPGGKVGVRGIRGYMMEGKLEHCDGVFCEGSSVYIEKSVLVLLEAEPSGILGQQEDVICLSFYLKSYLWKMPRREERRDTRAKSWYKAIVRVRAGGDETWLQGRIRGRMLFVT